MCSIHVDSDLASNFLGLPVEWPWSITNELIDAIMQLGIMPLEALAYLLFPEPETANYETLK